MCSILNYPYSFFCGSSKVHSLEYALFYYLIRFLLLDHPRSHVLFLTSCGDGKFTPTSPRCLCSSLFMFILWWLSIWKCVYELSSPYCISRILDLHARARARTHTHTHIYIYIIWYVILAEHSYWKIIFNQRALMDWLMFH
jgi:hypothetical protein